ncbi:gyaR [Symbiodinium sp. CCMP2456]|nr:gyaR [Symbiodinium sp. CCMP2456]
MAAGGNVDGWGLEKTHNMLRLILEAEPALLTARNGMNKTAAEWAKHEKKRQSAQFLSHYATMNPGLSGR